MEMVEQTASGSRVGLRLVEKRWLYVIDERASWLLGLAARGTGCTFGPDISKQCNQQNGFEFVVRAHQLAMEGYQWAHPPPTVRRRDVGARYERAVDRVLVRHPAPGLWVRAAEFGADVGECDKGGRSPLYAAASKST